MTPLTNTIIFLSLIFTQPTVISEQCFEDGSCRIEYSDGTTAGECRYPELGCN